MLHRCRPIRGSWLALLPALGCGGAAHGQTTSDPLQQLCVSICTLAYQCADAGQLASMCSADCADASLQSPDGGPPPSGCDMNQLVSAETACLQDSCSTYGSCIEQATATSGCAASSSSFSGCALCDQAGSCCSALAADLESSDAGDCAAFTTAGCNRSTDPSSFASTCQEELTVGQDFSLAACSH